VSEKHANFIQAGDECTAADVRAVIDHVRSAVLEPRHPAAQRGAAGGFADVPVEPQRGVVL